MRLHRESTKTFIIFVFTIITVVAALILTDALGIEVSKRLGPGLRPLGSRLVVGRRTLENYRKSIDNCRMVGKHQIGIDPYHDPHNNNKQAGIQCGCDDLIGSEQD